MNENIQIFQNENFGEIRVVEINDDPWFVAVDVCKCLDIRDTSKACERLDKDEKGTALIRTLGGEQQMLVINEPGLYSLVLRSRKSEAKEFKRWVTHDVIPSIRRTGMYMSADIFKRLTSDPRELAEILSKYADEIDRRKTAEKKVLDLENEIELKDLELLESRTKVSYYDLVLQCPDLLTTTQISKDYGWSAQQMNKFLVKRHVQYKSNGEWVLYQKYASNGYTGSKTYAYCKDNGVAHSNMHTYWTQKGRLFIYDLMKSAGHLPLMEKVS